MADHTPAPWRVALCNGRPIGIFAPEDVGKPGAVGNIVRNNGIGLPGSPTALANAYLIAAAPDLLAALRSINKVASPGHRTMDELIRDLDYITDAARLAIAKAEGLAATETA